MGKKKVNLLEGAAALIKHCESNECEGCVFCGDSGCEALFRILSGEEKDVNEEMLS